MTDEAVAPTCTETGLTEGSHCSRCNEVLVAQETVEALGHEYEDVPDSAVPPTCTEAGKKADKKCSRCGDEITGAEIEALGHEEVIDAAVEPTCTDTGLTEGSHCSRCNEVLVAQETVEALGHDPVTDPAVEPSCTEEGKTEGSHCSRCNEVLVAQETVEALGHDPVTDAAVEPTCTKEGKTEGSHCSRCNEVLVAQETVEALGHDPEKHAAVEASCETDGNTVYWSCSRCEKFFSDAAGENEIEENSWVIEATGHKWDEGVVSKEPGCTTAGEKLYTCSKCGDTKTEAIDALGHVEETIPGIEPTCTTTGLTAGTRCSRCEEILKEQEEIEALGHEEVIDEAVEATCTDTGLTEGKHCSRCNEVLVAQKTVNALGHDYQPVEGSELAPTCTVDGHEKDQKCSRCDDVIPGDTIPATGHTFGEWTTVEAPTCTDGGFEERVCSVCQTSEKRGVDATGHDLEEDYTVDTPQTCTTDGSESRHCKKCGLGFESRPLPATGHSFGEWTTVEAPTCTEAGSEERVCSACDAKETAVLDATGHSYDSGRVTKEPTTSEEGVMTYTCTKCGDTYDEVIPKVEETMGDDGTPTGKGASYSIADEAIRETDDEEGPAGTKFSKLRLKTTKQTSSSITIKWVQIKGAKKYVIYGAKCGKSMKKITTSTLDSRVIHVVSGDGVSLKKGTYYKFIVVALDGNDKVVSTSKVIHVVTKGGTYGNYSKVTVSKAIVTKAQSMKVGGKLSLRAKAVKASGVKVRTHRVLKYESSNKKIATVSSKGIIRAKAKGTCYVCAYTQDGTYRRVKVVVK